MGHFLSLLLTNAEDDLVDVNGGEVQEEEGEVDDEKEEAQNHTHPLLESLTCRKMRTQTAKKTHILYILLSLTYLGRGEEKRREEKRREEKRRGEERRGS